MKKISLFTLAVATSLALFAQDNHDMKTPMAQKVTFGIDAGVNLATLDFKEVSPAPNTNMKTSFHGGFMVDIPVSSTVHLVPSLLYSAQGTKFSVNAGVGGTVNGEMDLHYIYLAPAKLQLHSPGGFMFETGPQVGYLIKANQEVGNSEQDIKDQLKKLDVLWGAGIGYMTRVGFGIHARYNYGFSNVLNAEDDNNQMDGKARNRVVQIGLAYHFGANK
ncbi:MAG TPA: porin family protein [Chitinophagaceae bacterium]|jgi:hypothetical protein|nr:porin family protein [Chitinophagaceae bacterium]